VTEKHQQLYTSRLESLKSKLAQLTTFAESLPSASDATWEEDLSTVIHIEDFLTDLIESMEPI